MSPEPKTYLCHPGFQSNSHNQLLHRLPTAFLPTKLRVIEAVENCCVILSKLLNVSVPWYPAISNKYYTNMYSVELLLRPYASSIQNVHCKYCISVSG